MRWIILVIAIFLNALANILIKIGVRDKIIKFDFKSLLELIVNPAIILGILCFILALGAYGYVLTRMNLSIAYPLMTSIGFMVVILASWLILKEAITLVQIIGFIFILSGVWMVAK